MMIRTPFMYGLCPALAIASLVACGGESRERRDAGPSDAGQTDTGVEADANVVDSGPTTSGNSLVDRAREAGLTDLVAAIERSPAVFARLADDDEDLTLLGPSNAAVAAAEPSDPHELETWLLHHVVEGAMARSTIVGGPVLETAAGTWVLADPSAQTVGGARLADSEGTVASNGTLFVLEGSVEVPTIRETLERDPDLANLRIWVTSASSMVQMPLASAGPITLLAPTNSAASAFDFISLGRDDIDAAVRSVTLSARYSQAELTDGAEVSSGEGLVTVSVAEGRVRFTDENGLVVTVVEADIRAKNGVVHRVDGFLWDD